MDILWLWCNHSNFMQLLLRVHSGVRRKFSWGISFSDTCPFVFGVRCLWRHIYVSKPTFWRSLLTHYAYSSARTLLILCVIALNINHHRSKAVKHSSLRQSKLQLQNQVARMSHRIRAVEHRCVAGLVGVHPGLQDRILLNYTRIENAHKARKKILLWCIEVQQTFSFLFPCWNIIKFVNTSMLTTAVLSSCNCSIMLQKLLM